MSVGVADMGPMRCRANVVREGTLFALAQAMKTCSVFLQSCQELQTELRAMGVAAEDIALLDPAYTACCKIVKEEEEEDEEEEEVDREVAPPRSRSRLKSATTDRRAAADDLRVAMGVAEEPWRPPEGDWAEVVEAMDAVEDRVAAAAAATPQHIAQGGMTSAGEEDVVARWCTPTPCKARRELFAAPHSGEKVRKASIIDNDATDVEAAWHEKVRKDAAAWEAYLSDGGDATPATARKGPAPSAPSPPRAAASELPEVPRLPDAPQDDGKTEERLSEGQWEELNQLCLGRLHDKHVAGSPRERKALSWGRTLAYAKVALGAKGLPMRRATAERPCVIWVLNATETVEVWLAEHGFLDTVTWVDDAPTVVVLLGDGLRPLRPHEPSGVKQLPDVYTEDYSRVETLPQPDFVAVQMPSPEAARFIPQRVLELVKDVPAVVSTRFQLVANDRNRLSMHTLLSQVRCPFSACPGSALPHDDNGWIFGVWGEDLDEACTLTVPPLRRIPQRNFARKDKKSVCFWGIVDLKFDTSKPLLDRVKVLEAGDGKYSQFSGDGREIRERFQALYKLEEVKGWTMQELIAQDKKFMHDQAEKVGYGHLLPPQGCFPREYDPKLAGQVASALDMKLQEEEGDHVVLKLCNKTRAAGVVVVETKDLDSTLQELLVPPKDEELEVWFQRQTHTLEFRSAVDLQPGQFDENKRHWWSNECPMFIAERRCESVPSSKGGKVYDGTLRLGFALYRRSAGQPVEVDWLGAYWKLPKGPSGKRGSAKLNDIVVSHARTAGTAEVDPFHASEVFAALGDLLPRLFDGSEPTVPEIKERYWSQPALAAYLTARLGAAKQHRVDLFKSLLCASDQMSADLPEGQAKRCVSSYVQRWRSVLVAREGGQDFDKKNSEHLTRSLEFWPWNANTYYIQGVKLHQSHKHDEAVRCFYRSLALDPDFKAPYVYLGACHLQVGEFLKAVDISENGRARHPGPQFLYHIGVGLANIVGMKDVQARRAMFIDKACEGKGKNPQIPMLTEEDFDNLTRALDSLRDARSSSEGQFRLRKERGEKRAPWLPYDDELISWLEERKQTFLNQSKGAVSCRVRSVPHISNQFLLGWLAFTCRV